MINLQEKSSKQPHCLHWLNFPLVLYFQKNSEIKVLLSLQRSAKVIRKTNAIHVVLRQKNPTEELLYVNLDYRNEITIKQLWVRTTLVGKNSYKCIKVCIKSSIMINCKRNWQI